MKTLRTTFSAIVLAVGGGLARADIVHLDDVIAQFSMCIGMDCVNGENFSFDTLRLKENNLRIHFDDTSSSSSFPSNDWRIIINDSENGGASYFAIEDSTAGRQPFRIEAGAPANALYVENDGDVGIGTANPAVDVHIVTGNTPTLRLEQNSSAGFTAQTWDVAGNETNFFIRDVTNGSRLPFKIIPNAPTNSLYIASSGNTGLNTTSPAYQLDVNGGSDVEVARFQGSGTETKLLLTNSALAADWAFSVSGSADQFRVSKQGTGQPELTVEANGDLKVRGDIFSNNTQLNVPDYVFDSSHSLMPLGELRSFIEREGRLPNVPSASEAAAQGGINLTQLQMTLLEKVEELSLYTLAQQEVIDRLSAKVTELEKVKAGRGLE